MGCACNKNRAAASGAAPGPAGTYRVMVNGRKVYESANESAATTVAQRFSGATILVPGQDA